MSSTTASTFTTKLKQFNGTVFPAWGAQVKLVLEIKGTPSATSTTPLNDRVMKQKMAASIILAALNEKLAAEVYLMEHPLTMLRHLRMTYNVKCSASIGAAKREYMGLYLDGDDSMVEHIKTTRRVLDELQEQHVAVSDEEKRQNFMQTWACVERLRVGPRVMCDV
ncbi:hypothetical protein PHMEG_0006722 [Phytophthora megakarya]|uniref:Polyprotein n=1 Tax=Phytophthora megakarya TaxID=4795 RepID=A0A225WNI2_9STRA|nr:hypothetical protein PHMEG_0006722 [Phytophthora megakarya]